MKARWNPIRTGCAIWIVALSFTCTSPCRGETPERVVKFDLRIDSQPLEQALQEFSRQSGIQVIFFSRLTEGRRAPAVQGQYELQGALTALLSGSGLTFHLLNPRTVQIQSEARSADRATQPPESPPAGRRPPQDDTRVGGTQIPIPPESIDTVLVAATAEGLVATRTATPLREIPQSISIISQEQIQDQNDFDLNDALGNEAGVSVLQRDSLHSLLYSRGFSITTFHLDGGAALDAFDFLSVAAQSVFDVPDLGEFDHIEVLHGSDALFGGNGQPGATVSLVRKRPLSDPEFRASVQTGSWNNYRLEGDVTGPIAFDGRLQARLDVVCTGKDYFFDTARFEKQKIFAALKYDLTATTVLLVGGSFERLRALPVDDGLPRSPDGSDPHLPRSTALAFDWENYAKDTRETYLQLAQDFGERAKLTVNMTNLQTSAQYAEADEYASQYDPATHLLAYPAYAEFTRHPNTEHQFAFDATLTAGFDWLGRRIEIALGTDFTRLTYLVSVNDIYLANPPLINLNAVAPGSLPDPRSGDFPFFQTTDSPYTSNLRAFYASFRAYLVAQLSASLGGRLSDGGTTSRFTYGTSDLTESGVFQSKNTWKLSPYAGLMYEIGRQYSVYVSYADIPLSNGPLERSDGSLLPAEDGVNVEAGIKSSWRGGELTGSLAVYGIEQNQMPVQDLTAPASKLSPVCCYVPTGIVKGKGLDVGVTGRAAPGWLIGVSYDAFHFIGAQGTDPTPRQLFKLWTSADLPRSLRRWTIGGDLHAQSKLVLQEDQCLQANDLGYCTAVSHVTDIQKSYLTLNLRTAYRIDPHWRVTLGLSNVFDRTYYQTLGSTSGGSWYGQPRAFQLRIDSAY
jgi:outer membrane receptor for ferric coprogen and ferric-rhodotorulic acid